MNVMSFDRRDLRMMVSLFRMTLNDRFLGSVLGVVWAILSPLFLIGIFCFVFAFVFPGRLPGQNGTLPYIIWLISGYGPWLAFSEGLSTSTSSVVSSSSIVKNVAFKSELLPIVGVLMGLVPLLVAFVILVLLMLANGHIPSAWVLVLPIVIVLQSILIAGIGLFLSALNVFIRDTALILPNLLTLALFASPIFYPISAYPGFLQKVVVFNPLYVLAECFRAPILTQTFPSPWMILYLGVLAVVAFSFGLWWFRRLKPFFDSRL